MMKKMLEEAEAMDGNSNGSDECCIVTWASQQSKSEGPSLLSPDFKT